MVASIAPRHRPPFAASPPAPSKRVNQPEAELGHTAIAQAALPSLDSNDAKP